MDRNGKVKKTVLPDNVGDTTVVLFEAELVDVVKVGNAMKSLRKNGVEEFGVASLIADPTAIDALSKRNKDTDFVLVAVVSSHCQTSLISSFPNIEQRCSYITIV